MIRVLIILVIFSFKANSQKDEVKSLLNNSLELIQKIDNANESTIELLKKASSKKNVEEIKRLLANVLLITENAEKNAKQSVIFSDLAEQKSKSFKCLDAAQEADDAEDYCRHLVFQTHEVSIYAKKIQSENEIDYIQTYLNKALAYCQETYESIKNARIELLDGIKDLNECP